MKILTSYSSHVNKLSVSLEPDSILSCFKEDFNTVERGSQATQHTRTHVAARTGYVTTDTPGVKHRRGRIWANKPLWSFLQPASFPVLVFSPSSILSEKLLSRLGSLDNELFLQILYRHALIRKEIIIQNSYLFEGHRGNLVYQR